jgi:hypothetical protein
VRLLEHAERRGFPAVRAGRLRVRDGEIAWRQAVTLAEPRALLRLAAALALTTDGAACATSDAAPPR